MHERALVALGSNVGDRVAMLRSAVGAIRDLPGARGLRCSGLYETPAVTLQGVGPIDGPDAFLNAVVSVDLQATPHELLHALLAIERRLGRLPRDQRPAWGPRPIDLDLLVFGDRRLDDDELTLPHPRVGQRWFVLAPLCDLEPGWLVRVDGREVSAATALEQLIARGEASAGVGRRYAGPSWATVLPDTSSGGPGTHRRS